MITFEENIEFNKRTQSGQKDYVCKTCANPKCGAEKSCWKCCQKVSHVCKKTCNVVIASNKNKEIAAAINDVGCNFFGE
jgi:predicted amidophosphoribosyltransferase